MSQDNKVPNKKIRTLILLSILIIYLGTTIYIAITQDNNKLAGQEYVYADKDDEYYDDEYDDYYYDDDYDYYDENQDGELSVTSSQVTSLYSYIKLYPYVTGIKSNFKVSELTEEEKLRLVAASLKSKEKTTSQPVSDVAEKELILNGKTYSLVTPNVRYERYLVTSMYYDIFGSSANFDYTALMYDGDNIVYKYNQEGNGYIKYVSGESTEIKKQYNEVIQAERKGTKIILYLKVESQTEKYIFEQKEGYNYLYSFKERVIEEKNSL